MDNYFIIDGEDMDFIWNTIQEQQLIFHPYIAPNGYFDYSEFFTAKQRKPFILSVDRNILSSLLKFCENGSLKNKGESQLIGILMAWAQLNDIAISAGQALRERSTQTNSQEEGLVELQKFLEIFDKYPSQMWLEVAKGQLTEISPIVFTQSPAQNITVNYADGGDHYDMAVAALLHAVQIYRNKSMKPIDKVQTFYQWMCDKLLVSEYLMVYVTMLFTEQEGIKAPKNANSDNLDKIIAGCKNQAWDISYLTTWSTIYSNSDNYDKEILFATNDTLLKRIFVIANGPYGFNGLSHEIFTQKEYDRLWDYIEDRMSTRVKPDFGDDPKEYFKNLIEEEIQQISTMVKQSDS